MLTFMSARKSSLDDGDDDDDKDDDDEDDAQICSGRWPLWEEGMSDIHLDAQSLNLHFNQTISFVCFVKCVFAYIYGFVILFMFMSQ